MLFPKFLFLLINNPKITATVGDAHDLQFESNSLELIYMRNVIHYCNYPIKVFFEIYRCLKPGGYFLFSQVVPPEDSLSEEYDWLVGRNIHYPTHLEIINWMKNFQFINERRCLGIWLKWKRGQN